MTMKKTMKKKVWRHVYEVKNVAKTNALRRRRRKRLNMKT
jgi:hypothetical protein